MDALVARIADEPETAMGQGFSVDQALATPMDSFVRMIRNWRSILYGRNPLLYIQDNGGNPPEYCRAAKHQNRRVHDNTIIH